jgi:flagellar biosynthesis/type III secretory pathway M-ring protein FliF/YscJ
MALPMTLRSAPVRTTPGMTYQTASSTSELDDSSLAAGAEAGIGVSVGVVALLLLLLGYVVILRRRKRRRTEAGWIQTDEGHKPPPYTESYDMAERHRDRITELAAQDRQELRADRDPQEVPGGQESSELPNHETPQEEPRIRERSELAVVERAQEIASESENNR